MQDDHNKPCCLTSFSGNSDFREFMCSLSISTRGSMDQKLKWAFSIYDTNGDGYITKSEMYRIVEALYKTYDYPDNDDTTLAQWDELTPEERTLKVFQMFDSNKDGVLSLSEFIAGAKKDKTLALMMSSVWTEAGDLPTYFKESLYFLEWYRARSSKGICSAERPGFLLEYQSSPSNLCRFVQRIGKWIECWHPRTSHPAPFHWFLLFTKWTGN